MTWMTPTMVEEIHRMHQDAVREMNRYRASGGGTYMLNRGTVLGIEKVARRLGIELPEVI